jgi:hypothetical protein
MDKQKRTPESGATFISAYSLEECISRLRILVGMFHLMPSTGRLRFQPQDPDHMVLIFYTSFGDKYQASLSREGDCTRVAFIAESRKSLVVVSILLSGFFGLLFLLFSFLYPTSLPLILALPLGVGLGSIIAALIYATGVLPQWSLLYKALQAILGDELPG